MTNETVKQVFERYGLKSFYSHLQKMDTQFQHDQEWLGVSHYAPMIDRSMFAEFHLELIYVHNFADVETYKSEFPNAANITYSPCVVPTIFTLGVGSIKGAEFVKNKDSYRNFIMDYVEKNEIYTHSNFDIFDDRKTAAVSIDWRKYFYTRLSSSYFPQEVDVKVFNEFEEVLFSKKLGSKMCFPMYQDAFFILSGMGVIFSEDFYHEIVSGDLSISINFVETYLADLVRIGLDPYKNDALYQNLHYSYVNDVNLRRANGHLGLAKLNAYLQSIPYFKTLALLQ